MDSNIGKKLDGRYEITELIGVGGMADVYKAVDVMENRTVAVKILKPEFSQNEEFLRRFRNESKAIAVLSHPNIVKIYDVGFSDEIQFIVMEYIDGITLKEFIEQQGVLRWKDALHFVTQILRALQHAHDKGIVHRDIKPQNIMLFPDGTIKVMDFGIARFSRIDGKTLSDKTIGSVHYISPEQARGDMTDERSDIYSVGVMLYEMLTGRKPFDGENPVAIALKHMQEDPVPPREIMPSIPEALEEIVMHAMERDPARRYQSAAEMIKDIDTFKLNPSVVFGYKNSPVPIPVADNKYFDDEHSENYDDDEEYEDDDEENDDEEEEEEKNEALNKEKYEQGIKDYLSKEYACHITDVTVGETSVTIQGDYTGEGTFFLGEIPPFVDMFKTEKIEFKIPLSENSFSIQLDRYVTVGDFKYDRLLSKWAVFKEGADVDELVSHARYANVDAIHAKQSVEAVPLKSKKGLGGLINHGLLTHDLDELGISSATINIPISNFMHLSEQPGDILYTYGGKTYYFNEQYLISSFDVVLQQTSQRGILLIAPSGDAGELLKHPDYNGVAPYTMPNMTTVESTQCYAAALDFLAQRYSDPDMRIAHWIIHNEVDGGIHWTNMGDKPIATFMDTYLRSMRMCYNIVHQYDQHSEVFISFSHGWNIAAGGGWYKVRDMLDLMNQFSKAEGDFFWSLACHSYPAQLGNPCTWDDAQATFSMDTEYVTLKNLEVLDKWVGISQNQYKGNIRRSVWLSEAGTCSPSYEDKDLQDQAAGFAYGWKKINALDGINGIQWHSWFDHLGDGVPLGLRKYSDEEYKGEAKPVWTTYQKAGTDEEDDYFEQYLERIGIKSWEGLIQDIP
mgnify:CR=1 FL=1